jgi:hypothetical protein
MVRVIGWLLSDRRRETKDLMPSPADRLHDIERRVEGFTDLANFEKNPPRNTEQRSSSSTPCAARGAAGATR